MGEEVCAWIQLNAGHGLSADDVKDYCRDKITHFKIPRYIDFVDEYPMTVTGKIQKFVMRDTMTETSKRGAYRRSRESYEDHHGSALLMVTLSFATIAIATDEPRTLIQHAAVTVNPMILELAEHF